MKQKRRKALVAKRAAREAARRTRDFAQLAASYGLTGRLLARCSGCVWRFAINRDPGPVEVQKHAVAHAHEAAHVVFYRARITSPVQRCDAHTLTRKRWNEIERRRTARKAGTIGELLSASGPVSPPVSGWRVASGGLPGLGRRA